MAEHWRKVILAADATRPKRNEASAVALRDSRLLLTWSEFSGRGDNDRAAILGAVSPDRGETWGAPWTVVANTAGLNVMSPAIRRLGDGGLGLVYSHRERTSEASRRFVRSDDEGRTWSTPVVLPQQEPYQTGCHDRLTVLASGRLVAPLHCTDDWHAHYLHVRVAWSDDHGRTWQLGEAIRLPRVADSGESGCIEPDVAQRADGSLLLVIRTAMGTIFRAESHDEGETWTGLRSMEVVAPVAPSLLRRLPGSDDLLLIWNWHYDWREPLAGRRRPLACAISADGGASWPTARRKVLEGKADTFCSYPSCVFLGDEAFVTYRYTKARSGVEYAPDDPRGWTHLKAARLPLSWFYE